MTRRTVRIGAAILALLLGWSASAAAQVRPDLGRGGPPAPAGPRAGFGRGVEILQVEPLEISRPVVGRPFSAETVTEMVQELRNGDRIEQRTTGRIARDSLGRVRNERTVAGLGPAAPADAIRIVTITDPAGRVLYRLDENRKIAWRLNLPPPPPSRDLSDEGRPSLPPGQSLRTERLEPIRFDGVNAEGTRTVLRFDAGAIGNERPIEITSERWYSPELQVVVSTRRGDPRFGDVTYRLVDIVRAEPPAELFSVPTDFTIREQPRFPPARPR